MRLAAGCSGWAGGLGAGQRFEGWEGGTGAQNAGGYLQARGGGCRRWKGGAGAGREDQVVGGKVQVLKRSGKCCWLPEFQS